MSLRFSHAIKATFGQVKIPAKQQRMCEKKHSKFCWTYQDLKDLFYLTRPGDRWILPVTLQEVQQTCLSETHCQGTFVSDTGNLADLRPHGCTITTRFWVHMTSTLSEKHVSFSITEQNDVLTLRVNDMFERVCKTELTNFNLSFSGSSDESNVLSFAIKVREGWCNVSIDATANKTSISLPCKWRPEVDQVQTFALPDAPDPACTVVWLPQQQLPNIDVQAGRVYSLRELACLGITGCSIECLPPPIMLLSHVTIPHRGQEPYECILEY